MTKICAKTKICGKHDENKIVLWWVKDISEVRMMCFVPKKIILKLSLKIRGRTFATEMTRLKSVTSAAARK